jgi:TetR/AcrR family transcriptional regulator, tetracycline repressor protein
VRPLLSAPHSAPRLSILRCPRVVHRLLSDLYNRQAGVQVRGEAVLWSKRVIGLFSTGDAGMKIRARKRTARPPADKGLTEQKVVAAALQQIDTVGLSNFSLRDVARALRVYPTAVYWYVKGKDDLLGRVVAYASRDVAPPAVNTDWKAWLREMFNRYRRAIQQHPNIAPLIGTQLRANGGIRADLIERVLSTLVTAGFAEDRLVDAYNVVIGALIGFISQELAALPSENPEKWAEAHRKRISTLNVMENPTLARYLPKLANRAFIMRWTNGTRVPLDSSFDMFVDVIILGLEQKLKTRRK